METQQQTEIYHLNDRRKMIEDLKEGYLRIMQTIINSRESEFISPRFAATANQLMQEFYFKFKERLEDKELPPMRKTSITRTPADQQL